MDQAYSVEPGIWGFSPNNIVTVDNIILDENLEYIYSYSRMVSNWGMNDGDEAWSNRVHGGMDLQMCNPDVVSIIDSCWLVAQKHISNHFGVNFYGRASTIVRWRAGDGQSPHADKQLPDGSPSRNPENDVGSVIYLNDDYEGGQIYFPIQGIEFSPKPGSLVFFPGDINYLHGVKTVSKGTRYTLPNFWTAVASDNGRCNQT
jgi:hypothetical protein